MLKVTQPVHGRDLKLVFRLISSHPHRLSGDVPLGWKGSTFSLWYSEPFLTALGSGRHDN